MIGTDKAKFMTCIPKHSSINSLLLSLLLVLSYIQGAKTVADDQSSYSKNKDSKISSSKSLELLKGFSGEF